MVKWINHSNFFYIFYSKVFQELRLLYNLFSTAKKKRKPRAHSDISKIFMTDSGIKVLMTGDDIIFDQCIVFI